MDASTLLMFALPSIVVALSLIALVAYRMLRISQETRFREDLYRRDIEMRIADLSRQLTMSEDRFRQVNHLLLDAQRIKPAIDQPRGPTRSGFLEQLGVDVNGPVDKKLVFVLTPFNVQFEHDYEVIRDTVEELGFRCTRGDDETLSGAILPFILQQLVRARLVIANISGRNPNVFYELGFAHALNKPVLLVAQAAEDIPFDVAATRVLIYRDAAQLRERLKSWLVHTLAETAA